MKTTKNKKSEPKSLSISERPVSDVINDNMREYARAVVSERAIPLLIDGLKPTARRALYTSFKFFNSRRTKVNELAGRAVKFVPTGDAGTIGTVSNLAREWPGTNNYALYKPIGAVGSRVFDEQDTIAQPRYLSVELSDFAKRFLFNESEIWKMIPNYDESDQEIMHFNPIIPVCLLNGVEGIAYGVATKIFPRKPTDIVKIVNDILTNKSNIKEPAPWFRNFKGAVERENDKWVTYGKAEKVDTLSYRIIDLPVGMSRARCYKILDDLKRAGKIREFTDKCTDTFNFLVTVKRGYWTDVDDFMRNGIGSMNLNENIYVLDNDKKLLYFDNVVSLLREFVSMKLEILKDLKTHHIAVENFEIGLIKAKLTAIKKNLLKNKFKTRGEMIQFIIKDLTISEEYAPLIVEMKAYHFTDEYAEKLSAQLVEHNAALASWKAETNVSLFTNKITNFKEVCQGFN